MATVNKNFRIKHGLVVEGTTGTINGQNILTETGSDQYILDLVGGANLIDSVASGLDITDTVLSIDRTVVDTWYDAAGAASSAQTAAESYADGLASNYDAAGSASAAQTAAQSYADGLASNYDPAGSASSAQTAAQSYTDLALEDYTPTNSLDATVGGYGYLKSADLSGYATESYVGTAIDNLVDGAPGLLDTLNEIAAAIADDENYATTMTTALSGKQNSLTAGSNIDITADTISVTGLDSADISDFNTAALSATESAYDASGAASTAETNANSYTDGQITNLTDGTNSFQTVNIEDVIAQRAASTEAMGTTQASVFSWDGADYRSAKVLVKVANGVHTQISELMITLDTANNVGVSEYGITYSNGTELAAISADYSAGMVRILATPANTNTDVTVFATLVI